MHQKHWRILNTIPKSTEIKIAGKSISKNKSLLIYYRPSFLLFLPLFKREEKALI